MNPRLHAALLLLGIAVVVAILFWPVHAEQMPVEMRCGQFEEGGPVMCIIAAKELQTILLDHKAAVNAAMACGVWKKS